MLLPVLLLFAASAQTCAGASARQMRIIPESPPIVGTWICSTAASDVGKNPTAGTFSEPKLLKVDAVSAPKHALWGVACEALPMFVRPMGVVSAKRQYQLRDLPSNEAVLRFGMLNSADAATTQVPKALADFKTHMKVQLVASGKPINTVQFKDGVTVIVPVDMDSDKYTMYCDNIVLEDNKAMSLSMEGVFVSSRKARQFLKRCRDLIAVYALDVLPLWYAASAFARLHAWKFLALIVSVE